MVHWQRRWRWYFDTGYSWRDLMIWDFMGRRPLSVRDHVVLIRDPPTARSGDQSVRDFKILLVRSEIWKFILVLVRFGLRFRKFSQSWSELAREFRSWLGPRINLGLLIPGFDEGRSLVILSNMSIVWPYYQEKLYWSWNKVYGLCPGFPNNLSIRAIKASSNPFSNFFSLLQIRM